LNAYGRGIDEAQSLRGSSYTPNVEGPFYRLSFGGRVDQDFRAVLSSTLNHAPRGPYLAVSRTRVFYRNVTTLGKGFRVSAVVGGENTPTLRRAMSYEPATRPGEALVASALLQYRAKEGVEFAVGRDSLPTGLNIPDQTAFIKARNRFGYYDTPTQAKAFFWGKRWQVAPFAFAPSGREPAPIRESGGGVLAEYDLLGKGKTIVGVNALRGSDRIGNRTVAGLYTRLGFGSWGILAEHDITSRSLHRPYRGAEFGQNADYLQVFVYPREWLLLSAITERLGVENPYSEKLWAYKGEVAARLSGNISLGMRLGAQRDARTGAVTPVASVQLAMKTVQ
jgi:hypothetical protein